MDLEISQRLEERRAASERRNRLSENAKTLRLSREVNPSADTIQVRQSAAKVLGAVGGVAKSVKKSAASRANGALGGRPRNKPAGL